jgi:MFS superfamily sulfate permease-like transporter
LINGVPVTSLFKSYIDVDVKNDNTVVIRARYSAIFSNWLLFRRHIVALGLAERRNVVVDFTQCKLVDHSVMEKLHELEADFEEAGLHLELQGLEGHRQLSTHEFSTRKRSMTRLRRVTVVAEEHLERELAAKLVALGASGFTVIPCHGMGRTLLEESNGDVAVATTSTQVRIEAVVPREVAESIMDFLQLLSREHRLTACQETVEVLQADRF